MSGKCDSDGIMGVERLDFPDAAHLLLAAAAASVETCSKMAVGGFSGFAEHTMTPAR